MDWLKSIAEYQNWGFNALIVGSVGTIFFTFLEAWGLWRQNKLIWKEKSGESVSVGWFSYLGFLFLTLIVYGYSVKSISIVINGLVLGPLHFPILLGLWKFKGFSHREKLVFTISAMMLLAMILLPWKNIVFVVINFGTIISLSLQPWEIWKNKNAGMVEIRLISVYFVSTVFWVIYAYFLGEWALKIITPIALFLFGLTIFFWLKYRKK